MLPAVRRIAPLALALSAASTVQGAFPLVVDDAGVHPPAETEWVVAADALRTTAHEAMSATGSLAVGLAPRLEGSLGFGYGWLRHRHLPEASTREGVLDFTVGLKALLTGEAAPFAFALSATAKLPTASSRLGLGTGHTDLNLLAIGTWSGNTLSLDGNVGFTWTAAGRRAERAGDAWFTGVALRWQASRRHLLFVESYGTWFTDGVTEAIGAVRAGWQWECRPGWLLGAALGTGYGPDAPEVLGTVGVTLVY